MESLNLVCLIDGIYVNDLIFLSLSERAPEKICVSHIVQCDLNFTVKLVCCIFNSATIIFVNLPLTMYNFSLRFVQIFVYLVVAFVSNNGVLIALDTRIYIVCHQLCIKI